MSTTDVQLPDQTEFDLVEQWRAEELERAGYEPNDAAVLATSSQVDLHVAIDLLARGCPPDLAIQILV